MSKASTDSGSIRKRVRTAVKTLERRYDANPLKNGRSGVEQLVYCIAARQNPERRAAGAIRDLKARFAGWNEVRVSSVLEIADILRQHDVANPIPKAEQIIRALGRTFADSHRVKLDELTRDQAEDIRTYMTRKVGLPSPVIADFLFSALSYAKFPVDESVGRMLQRLGLVSNKLDFPKLEKTISDGLTAREAAHAYRILEAHAAAVCTEKDPLCDRCPLAGDCADLAARKTAAAQAALEAQKAEEAARAAAKAEADRLKAEAEKAKAKAKADAERARLEAQKAREKAKLQAAKSRAAAASKKPAPKPAARKPARPAPRVSRPRPHPVGKKSAGSRKR